MHSIHRMSIALHKFTLFYQKSQKNSDEKILYYIFFNENTCRKH